MNAQEKIDLLKQTRPDVAISITWEVDESFTWDGDGEDPSESGYMAHNVTVTATCIRGGTLIEGCAYLGGCYAKPGEPKDNDVSGYAVDMIEEALEEMDAQINKAA